MRRAFRHFGYLRRQQKGPSRGGVATSDHAPDTVAKSFRGNCQRRLGCAVLARAQEEEVFHRQCQKGLEFAQLKPETRRGCRSDFREAVQSLDLHQQHRLEQRDVQAGPARHERSDVPAVQSEQAFLQGSELRRSRRRAHD